MANSSLVEVLERSNTSLNEVLEQWGEHSGERLSVVIVEHQGSASPRCVFEYSRVQNFLKALRADPRVAFIYIIVRYRRDKIVLIITYELPTHLTSDCSCFAARLGCLK